MKRLTLTLAAAAAVLCCLTAAFVLAVALIGNPQGVYYEGTVSMQVSDEVRVDLAPAYQWQPYGYHTKFWASGSTWAWFYVGPQSFATGSYVHVVHASLQFPLPGWLLPPLDLTVVW